MWVSNWGCTLKCQWYSLFNRCSRLEWTDQPSIITISKVTLFPKPNDVMLISKSLISICARMSDSFLIKLRLWKIDINDIISFERSLGSVIMSVSTDQKVSNRYRFEGIIRFIYALYKHIMNLKETEIIGDALWIQHWTSGFHKPWS